MKKIHILRDFVLLLFGVLIILFFMLSTEPGLYLSVHFATRLLPGELSIDNMHGRLLGELEFDGLHYKDKDNNIIIRKLQHKWQPLSLLNNKINIQMLMIEGLDLTFGNTRIRARNYVLNAYGSIGLAGGHPVLFHLDSSALKPGFTPFHSTSIIEGDFRKLHLHGAVQKPFSASLDATFKPYEQTFNLTSQWKKLQLPLTGRRLFFSKEGSLTAKGSFNDYTVKSHAFIKGKRLPGAEYNVAGRGDLTSLTLDKINIDTLDGDVTGELKLKFQPTLKWNARFKGRKLNPSLYWYAMNGDVNFDLQSLGNVNENNTKVSNITGNLHGHPLSGKIIYETKGELKRVNTKISAGRNTLSLNGSVAQRWNIDWNLNFPDLEQLLLYSAGSLHSTGSMTGPRKTPKIISTLSGSRIKFNNDSVNKLRGNINIDLNVQGDSKFALSMNKLNFRRHYFSTIQLRGSGKTENHTISGAFANHEDILNFKIQG